jgi:hypothetical protein
MNNITASKPTTTTDVPSVDLRIPIRQRPRDVSEGLRREIARRRYQRLRASGLARTMTQASLARMVGVSTVTIAAWKAREEALDYLIAVVDALTDPVELKIGEPRH